MAGKRALIFAVDVGASMSPDDELAAEAIIISHIQSLMLQSKVHEVGLVTYGSPLVKAEETEECEYDGAGVSEPILLDKTRVAMLKTVRDRLHARTDGDGDPFAALQLALEAMKKRTLGKKYERSIYLVSNLRARLPRKENYDLEEELGRLSEGFQHPKAPTHFHLVTVGEVDSSDEVQKGNVEMWASLVNHLGDNSTRQSAADLLREVQEQPRVKKPQVLSLQLKLGSGLAVPCRWFKKVDRFKLPSLKLEDRSEPNPDDPEGGSTNKLKRITVYRDIDNPDVDVPFAETVKAAKYGADYVIISPDDLNTMKYSGEEPLVDILGFTTRDKVPRYYYMVQTCVLTAQAGMEGSERAISALSRALSADGGNRVAIARFVPKAGAEPRLVALVPDRTGVAAGDRLLIETLPFGDDIRPYTFPSFDDQLPQSRLPSAEQVSATARLVDAFMLPKTGTGAGRFLKEPARKGLLPNPLARRVEAALFRRALDPACDVLSDADDAAAQLSPDPALLSSAEPALGAYAGVFSFEKQSSKGGKRPSYWVDEPGGPEEGESGGARAAGKRRRTSAVDEGDGKSEEQEGGGPAVPGGEEDERRGTSGSAANVRTDMERLACSSASEESFLLAVEHEKAVLASEASAATDDRSLRNAVDRFLSLRTACDARNNAVLYDSFLRQLAAKSGLSAVFWDRLNARGAGFLTKVKAEGEGEESAGAAELLAGVQASQPNATQAEITTADDEGLE